MVELFDPHNDPRAERSRAEVLHLLQREARPFSRSSFVPGHITTSALILAPENEAVLLVFHPRLHRWLQPGGHVEASDASLLDAARREAREETGIALSDRRPAPLVGIDVHEIPARGGEPAHRHHDLMFGFAGVNPAAPAAAGTLRVTWCPPDRLGGFGADSPLRRAVARMLGRPV
jgi:8-oxo-dGTP pyrophosphatase MutT (NUDIX family)